jgi:thiol-disulfide isomerase/thioredoxin
MRGRGTLVNIWATWCGTCNGELLVLSQLAKEYAHNDLHVVLVSVDEPEEQSRLAGLLATQGFALPAWVAALPLSEFKWELAKTWKGNIPVTFLYDHLGRRRFFWDGPVEAEDLKPIINDFLAGKRVDGEKHFALSPGITGPQHEVP